MRKQVPLVADPAVGQYVATVGRRLASHAERTEVSVQLHRRRLCRAERARAAGRPCLDQSWSAAARRATNRSSPVCWHMKWRMSHCGTPPDRFRTPPSRGPASDFLSALLGNVGGAITSMPPPRRWRAASSSGSLGKMSAKPIAQGRICCGRPDGIHEVSPSSSRSCGRAHATHAVHGRCVLLDAPGARLAARRAASTRRPAKPTGRRDSAAFRRLRPPAVASSGRPPLEPDPCRRRNQARNEVLTRRNSPSCAMR